jgi:hypothetical protein
MAELDEVAASLSLSYALLGEESRGLWRRGVFVGDFSGPAAGVVWALEAEAAGEQFGRLTESNVIAQLRLIYCFVLRLYEGVAWPHDNAKPRNASWPSR